MRNRSSLKILAFRSKSRKRRFIFLLFRNPVFLFCRRHFSAASRKRVFFVYHFGVIFRYLESAVPLFRKSPSRFLQQIRVKARVVIRVGRLRLETTRGDRPQVFPPHCRSDRGAPVLIELHRRRILRTRKRPCSASITFLTADFLNSLSFFFRLSFYREFSVLNN